MIIKNYDIRTLIKRKVEFLNILMFANFYSCNLMKDGENCMII